MVMVVTMIMDKGMDMGTVMEMKMMMIKIVITEILIQEVREVLCL